MTAKVYIVGAGPGDPSLITVKGLRAIQRADVVIHDRLASDRLLAEAPPSAELIYVGKTPGAPSTGQDEINRIMADGAARGLTVVRLKGGDPLIFGRGAEEAGFLSARDIDFEIIPGITAASAAAAAAGVPLTDRRWSSSVTIVTGREGDSSSPGVDWEAAAKSGATIVVYMGRGGLKEIASRLIDAGLDAKTPVVVVERASLPNQRAVSGCVDEIASICERESIEAPCITIIGRVAGEYPKLASAKRLPLFGRRVVITRSRGGEEALEAALSALGAEVVRLATIEIRDAADEILAEGLSMLRDAEWVVFTSANGVRTFSGALARAALDSRTLGGRRVAAVGPATARALGEIGICADLVPERFSGEGLLAALLAATGEGERLLLWRARGAREDLAKGLAEAGRRVVEVEAYESVMPSAVDEASVESLKAEPPFAVLFSSASTANNFAQIIGEEDVRNVFAVSSAISIGPATTDALRALGVEPAVEASPHTFDGLVAATLKAAQR